ncbi:MAG: biotin synthetase [Bdellovibrionaceae bacterium]|nr:biotin synthetase [Bdellovibrio sp.]
MSHAPTDDIRIGQITHQWAQVQKLKSFFREELDSTNALAKKEAFEPVAFDENVILYLTENQTAGRGRGSNTWSSSTIGSQLFSTWSFLLEKTPLPTLSPLIGLAIYRAALASWPFLEWNLKAPNDLYIDDKKVAGLLIETVSQGQDLRLLIGFGFNVFSAPAEIKLATSLAHELPPETPLLAEDWIAFLERILFELSLALQWGFEPLNTTARTALVSALNLHPHLKEEYVSLDAAGNLATASKKILWSEL